MSDTTTIEGIIRRIVREEVYQIFGETPTPKENVGKTKPGGRASPYQDTRLPSIPMIERAVKWIITKPAERQNISEHSKPSPGIIAWAEDNDPRQLEALLKECRRVKHIKHINWEKWRRRVKPYKDAKGKRLYR